MRKKKRTGLIVACTVLVLVVVLAAVVLLQKLTEKKHQADAEVTGVPTQAADAENSSGKPDETPNSGKTEQGSEPQEKEEETVWTKIFGSNVPELAKEQGDYSILIKKGGEAQAQVEEEQIYRKLCVTIEGTGLDESAVLRVSREAVYRGIPKVEEPDIPEEEKNVPLVREPKTEDEDTVRAINIAEKNGKTTIELELNSVYETRVTEDKDYVYLTLKRPFELYDRIIVLDAGHGGYDIGTSGGGVTEASINLKVIGYLKELMDQREDIKVYYTRLDNTLPDLSTRVEFANALHADFLISVHCNYNPSASMNGIEVMYSKLQVVDENFSSRILADKCIDYVCEETGMTMRYMYDRSENLHLMKYCKMPCALVEFGFMSNKNDLALIKTEEKQRACAYGIYRVIDEHYQTSEETEE